MFQRVLVTEGGPHPAEDWARITCEDLVPLDGLATGLLASGMILRGRIIEILTQHYADQQEDERNKLRDNPAQYDAELAEISDFGHVFAELQAAASGTPWEGHITGTEVIDAIRTVLGDHVRHMRHVERLCRADAHPTEPLGQAYRARHGLPPSPTAPETTPIALPPPDPA
jgi:hypothetical protein